MARSEGEPTPASRHPHHVLAVDDDPGVLASYEMALADDYMLHFAEDGSTAVRLATGLPIDLVLLDIRLPDLDGIEVLRAVRRHKPRLPVIIVTAYRDHDTAAAALNLGATGYLIKPVDVDDLWGAIRAALPQPAPSRSDPGFETPRTPLSIVESADCLIRECNGKKLTVAGIARALGISRRQLNGAFRREVGVPVKEYQIRVRIEKALTLLLETDLPIKVIASETGYRSLDHFYRDFRRLTGLTPCEYRRSTDRKSSPAAFSKE